MTLLRTMFERPLDPGYAEAAARKAAARAAGEANEATGKDGYRSLATVVTAVLVGLLFATAAVALRPDRTAGQVARERLVSQVTTSQHTIVERDALLVRLQAEIRTLEAQALASAGDQGTKAQTDALVGLVGAAPVAGPGLQLTITDAPTAAAADGSAPRNASGFDPGRLSSADLQIIVNGLWQSGAEGISINGQRLTGTTAIRFAGQAVLVNYRPLSSPYVVSVVGNPDEVQRRFEANYAGAYLTALQSQHGITADLKHLDRVVLPADPTTQLVRARVADPR